MLQWITTYWIFQKFKLIELRNPHLKLPPLATIKAVMQIDIESYRHCIACTATIAQGALVICHDS